VTEVDGTLLYANSAFKREVGEPKSSKTSPRFQEHLTPGSAIFYETQFLPSLLLRGSLEEISFDLLRANGERAPVFVNATLRAEKDGIPAHILLAAFGAKQRRLYEAELLRARRESELVAEVVRRSSDAIIRLSAQDLVESWNRGAEQIFGLAADRIIGKPLYRLIPEEHHGQLLKAIEQVKRGHETVVEIAGCRDTGQTVDVSISMTPHMEAPGILVGYSAIIRDTTARKLAEKTLLQTEKLASVGRLASSIAHEINNPLEAVTNLLYLLDLRINDDGNRKLLRSAQEELARVSHIATHTLRFHKQSSDKTKVDVRAVFDLVLGLYRARLRDAGITSLNDSVGDSHLLCYEGELRQILVNLVANSFDAMRSGGKLILRSRQTVRAGSDLKVFRITIADTGSGMEPAVFERLFEPFFSTKGIGGTGLGLWITKDLVEKNRGTVRVRTSTRQGRTGTVVRMQFSVQPD